MVDVHILGLAEVAVAVGLVAETGVTEGEHGEAMDAVSSPPDCRPTPAGRVD